MATAVLKVRDNEGNVTEITSIKGTDGKSAYQYAVDGGFEGTEEEFGSLLANVGGSETTKRPTAEYVHDFVNDGRVYFTYGEILILHLYDEEATDEEKSLVGKEIADIEFERSTGEWVSIKDISEIDFLPYISMLNHIVRTTVEETDAIAFASIYYPSTRGWLSDAFTSGAINQMRVTYYTD